MSLPTDVIQTEVDNVRELLGSTGTLDITTVNYERSFSIAADKVIVRRKPIYNVMGVWLVTDGNKSGTNYYTGGSFSRYTGEITLGISLPSAQENVFTDYAHDNGLTDLQIASHIQSARLTIDYETDKTNNFTSGSLAYECQKYLTAWMSLLVLQTPNMLQTGFNYRVGDLEVQTKIWGEGMISETLIRYFKDEVYSLLRRLGRKYGVEMTQLNTPKTFLNMNNTRRIY